MKILHITASYKPAYIYGGPIMSVAMLCEQLIKANIQAEVFSTTANGLNELAVEVNKPMLVDGVKVTYFKRITKDHTHFSPALLKAVRSRAKEFDVVHIHAWWNLVSVLSCIAALGKGVPVIVSPRGTLSPYSFTNKNIGSKKLIHHLFGKKLLQRCHIHATSLQESDAVQQLLQPVSVTILPNFVRLPTNVEHREPHRHEELKLIFFSRIEEKKGLDILLGALKLITVPCQLTIAGNGDEAYINQLKSLIDPQIPANVNWIGFHHDDKFNLLASHHLFVLPSHDENFGNAVIESLSVGTPVLISENVGLASYVVNNNLGWICQTTADSVGAAINAIACDQPAMQNIRDSAPGIIRQDFAEDKLAAQYIQFYRQVTPVG